MIDKKGLLLVEKNGYYGREFHYLQPPGIVSFNFTEILEFVQNSKFFFEIQKKKIRCALFLRKDH